MPSDRYRLIAPLGRGGTATVHLAEDTELRRQVAVKVLHPELAAEPAVLGRFRREARAAAKLSHPNITAVHDWSDEEGEALLVMEYLGGGSLRAMLDQGALLSPSQAISVGLEACRGLHHAHEEGLVHRDIKPANLLFGHDGRLRIADFGIAGVNITDPGGLIGTAKYASPEQVRGERITAASDVYSLGLVLMEALTGAVPHASDTRERMLQARSAEPIDVSELPPNLGEAVAGMVAHDPDERLSAAKAGVALLKAAEGLPRPQPLELAGATTRRAALPDDTDLTAHLGVDETEVAEPGELIGLDDGPARRWPWLLVTLALIAGIGYLVRDSVQEAIPTSVEIPSVAGLERDAALAELGDVWELDEKFDRVSDVPAGSVIRTDPPAGESLDEGETLAYWVSLGPPLIRVPRDQILGRTFQQAEGELESVGLVVGEVTEVFDEEIGAGLVMAVDAEQAEVPEGSAVDLTVSKGAQARVIQVFEGVEFEAYVEGLGAAGLAAEVLEDWDPEVPVGDIVSVDPGVGEEVPKGGTVTVVVSKGPEPVPIPPTSGLDLTPAIEALGEAGFLAGELGGSGLAGCKVVGTDPPEGTPVQPGSAVQIIMSEC